MNVEELVTECTSAPMSGEPLFKAHARLLLPAGVTVSALSDSLDKAGSDLTIEIAPINT